MTNGGVTVVDTATRVEEVLRKRRQAERDAIAAEIAARDEREREIESLRAEQPELEAEHRAAAAERDEYVATVVAPAEARLAELHREAAARSLHAEGLHREALAVRDRIAQLERERDAYTRDANGRLTPDSRRRAISRLRRDENSSTLYAGVRISGDMRALQEIAIDESRVPGAELREWRQAVLDGIA